MDSAITKTRNLPVFMVPDEEYPNATIIDFAELFKELSGSRPVRRVGLVGAAQMPMSVYRQIEENFRGVEMVDITEEYLRLRYLKSPWELEQMRQAFELADQAYDAMVKAVSPGRPRVRGGRRRRVRGAQARGQRLRLQGHRRQRQAVQRGGAHRQRQGDGGRRDWSCWASRPATTATPACSATPCR